MPDFDALKNRKLDLIRKALDGGVFVAKLSDPPITNLTTYTAATTTAPEKIELTALPSGWKGIGALTDDGATHAREIATSDVSTFGETSPSRTDVTADTTRLSFVAQETNLLSIGMYTGADTAGIVPAAGSGEVSIEQPILPTPRKYRALSVAVDKTPAGDIFVARYLPKAQAGTPTDQGYTKDGVLQWGVTLIGQKDDTVGYSVRYLFGGAGWKALLTSMGFPAAA